MSQTSVFEFAQRLEPKPVYSINNIISISTPKTTVYRHLQTLKNLGFIIKSNRGHFRLNRTAILQPKLIIEKLSPSLLALKKARRFGRSYNNSDIKFARNNIKSKFITLDYKAWELTRYQTPSELYMYVKDVDKTAAYLKENRFKEGQRGRVVILPIEGNLENEIERVYLDCIAKGGRSIQDAIAIELLYSDRLTSKGNFPIESVLKVQEDLPHPHARAHE